MAVDGYYKHTARYMGDVSPYILLCPQCNDALECTSNKDVCYCFGCGITLRRDEVKEMSRFIGEEEPVPYREE